MATPKYQHIISFGNACNIASGLSRLGLREHSGPFDWFMSDLRVNLTLLANHFEDFLNPDYLEHKPHPLNNGEYINKKYRLGFIHDFDPLQDAPPLSQQLPAVQAKYERRIAYLYDSIKEPTLFVRQIANDSEAKYLTEHIDDVTAQLKSYHPGNDLLLMSNHIDAAAYPQLKIFEVQHHKDDHILGLCFDDNKELHDFLISPDTYPLEKRAKNVDFFIKKELLATHDVSMNEMRIAKERLELEQKAWAAWCKALSEGKKLTDILVRSHAKKVVLLGANEFMRILIPQLKEAQITPLFITGWRIPEDENGCFMGVPVKRRVRKPMSDEERKKFDEENNRRIEAGLPLLPPPRRNWLLDIPGIEEADAAISTQIDDLHFLMRERDKFPFQLYTATDLVGAEPVYLPPKE